jgi:Zn ribbon nucleic-acid-binding protein
MKSEIRIISREKCPQCKSVMEIVDFDPKKPKNGYKRKCIKCGFETPSEHWNY